MKRKHYKAIAILMIILVLFVLYFTFRITEPDSEATRADIGSSDVGNGASGASQIEESVEVDKTKSSFGFEGFGPGKTHLGEFEEWDAELIIDGTEIIGVIGTIKAETLDTGIGGLNDHLKSGDFFDVANYPEVSFVSSSLKDGKLTGELTLRGITKEISFPIEKTGDSISADFVIDSSEFGIDVAAANPEVRIFFELLS
jgi:polyisoprenoid-binding protein YceI